MAGRQQGVGLTRWRDLLLVALIAAVAGYLLLQWNYHRFPRLPRLAGVPAAVIGIGEGLAGWRLRARIRGAGEPIEPLAVARAVTVAKATALAAAAFGGLWIGVLAYVVPLSGEVVAAAGDRTTALVGVVGAAVMLAGALLMEHCCLAPPDSTDDDPST